MVMLISNHEGQDAVCQTVFQSHVGSKVFSKLVIKCSNFREVFILFHRLPIFDYYSRDGIAVMIWVTPQYVQF